jgi:hypothetical protein
MEEDLFTAVVGVDEAEALVLDNLLDGAEHKTSPDAQGAPMIELMRRTPYVNSSGARCGDYALRTLRGAKITPA